MSPSAYFAEVATKAERRSPPLIMMGRARKEKREKELKMGPGKFVIRDDPWSLNFDFDGNG